MNPLARIIDANANRAREALRVMEDAARFGLNDQGLTAGLKELRHRLQEVIDSLPLDRVALVASRDTDGDVGTQVKTSTELSRLDLRHTVAAAASRLVEALRSLEESSKAMQAGGAAGAFESIRYRAYALDRQLTLALGAPGRRQWRLCVLITEALCLHHPWKQVAQLALEGGADCLQLREKSMDGGELLRRAAELVALARPRGAATIVNDRPDVALLGGADGVHLGQTDVSVIQVRQLAGKRLLVGVSTENLDQAHAASAGGADYIALGPMFPTSTKEKPRLAGPQYVRSYMADKGLAQVPHLAIGGVTVENIGQLAEVGCRGVAVSSFVCSATDPAAACRSLIEGLGTT